MNKATKEIDGNALSAVLVEYNVLNTEVQNRSNAQNTLLQMHIATITTILGGIFLLPLGRWLIFLVPIESALFGLWWLDNALNVVELRAYLSSEIESRIKELSGKENVVRYNTELIKSYTKKGSEIIFLNFKKDTAFYMVVFSTFILPSFISIICTVIFSLTNNFLENKYVSIFFLFANIIFFLTYMWVFYGHFGFMPAAIKNKISKLRIFQKRK